MRNIQKILLVLLTIFGLGSLAACSSQYADVKSVATAESKRQTLEEGSVYSSVHVKSQSPSTIVYTWTYRDAVNIKTTKVNLTEEAYRTVIQNMLDNSIFPDLLAKKVKSPIAKYIYMTKDGKQVATLTFRPSPGVSAVPSK